MGQIWKWQEVAAPALWQEARTVIAADGLLAIPTETFYALAVNPFREAALARLLAVKARPAMKPVLVLVASLQMLDQVAVEVPAVARELMGRFWPGPLTLILPARSDLPVLLTGRTGTIGVRQPRQPQTCRLLNALGMPLTGTSANRAGRPPLTRAAEVAREFGDQVNLILDAGPCPGGEPSTILDVSGDSPRLVRQGALPVAELMEALPQLR